MIGLRQAERDRRAWTRDERREVHSHELATLKAHLVGITLRRFAKRAAKRVSSSRPPSRCFAVPFYCACLPLARGDGANRFRGSPSDLLSRTFAFDGSIADSRRNCERIVSRISCGGTLLCVVHSVTKRFEHFFSSMKLGAHQVVTYASHELLMELDDRL